MLAGNCQGQQKNMNIEYVLRYCSTLEAIQNPPVDKTTYNFTIGEDD